MAPEEAVEGDPDNIMTYEVKMTNEKAPSNDVFYTALIAATAEIGAGVVRGSVNPHFKNRYADLSAVSELIKPVLAKHGLAIIQSPGDIIEGKLTMNATLLHESGRTLYFEMQLPIGDKLTPQALGSAITYARRYQLKAIFCLADVDDDGEAASHPGPGLMAAISCATTTAQLEAIRSQVEAEGSDADRAAFISKRRELKSK